MTDLRTSVRFPIGWAFAVALACVAGAPAAGAAGAPAWGRLAAQSDRKCKEKDSCDEQERRELERLRRQIEHQIEQALKTLDTQDDSLDARTLRITREQLTQAIRALEQTRQRLEARAAAEAEADALADVPRRRYSVTRSRDSDGNVRVRVQPAQPAQPAQPPQPGRRPGWLGVSLSSAGDEAGAENGRKMFQFRGYPIVVAVEPSSPARRAGLLAGDVLLAFDGIDLKRNTVPLEDLLRPGNRLPIRIRRDGEVRDVTVIVGQRPQAYDNSMVPTPVPPREPDVVIVPKMKERKRVAPTPPPDRAPFPFPYTYSTSSTPIAGCELTRISGDFSEYFGVDAGLLVLKVAPGTPAARAGLRAGDVIIAANGEDIESVRELSEAIAGDGTPRPVKLDVVRKKERLRLTLR